MQAGTPVADLWIPGVCEDAGAVSKTHDHSQQPVHAAQQRMSARQCHQLRSEGKYLATWGQYHSVSSQLHTSVNTAGL